MRFRLGACALLATGLAGLGFSGAAGAPETAESGKKPNIVFVILDDVGIDQLSLYGYGGVLPAKTPNIDKIAAAGVTFTNVWSMPECSPSRAAFFTGRYPLRTGVQSAIVNNHLPQEYVSSFESTLPRVLEKAGYKSALVGKYHLGNEKDPAGNCAPLTRGFDVFRGNMTAGPPSIDETGGGGNATLTCGYHQGPEGGACYTLSGDSISCSFIGIGQGDPGTSPARTCLQHGGLFRPVLACGASAPTRADFDRYNAYYVWPRIAQSGDRSPLSTQSCAAPQTNRQYMTTQQSVDGSSWWKNQSGPRMLTLSFNAMHTPFQKAPTTLVPDPGNDPDLCNSAAPERTLLNSILEGADAEIGKMLASVGLATLAEDGHTIQWLNLKNTVVVIVGDNGSYGSTVRVADGFDAARSKATVYQTGVSVPLIVAGSVVASPGRKVDELVNVVDLFGLFGEVAGVNVDEVVPPARRLDSKSIMPYLAKGTVKEPVRKTSYTEVGAGTFTPDPAERSWPCVISTTCNDTLLWDQGLCEDNGGTWYGPGGAQQVTSCCAITAGNANMSIIPPHQAAVRNKRFKLVEIQKTDCSRPLQAGQEKPFPWAEYQTVKVREFYDLQPNPSTNPLGLDQPEANYLKDCPAGADPRTCIPQNLRDQYDKLAEELVAIRKSARPEASCLAKGDGNRDLRVNDLDIEAFKKFRGGPSQYDVNVDGRTDGKDLDIIKANLGTDCLGLCARADLNRDGKVNATDMTLLSAQTGKCSDITLCGGDLDGDEKVGNLDVDLMVKAQGRCGTEKSAQVQP